MSGSRGRARAVPAAGRGRRAARGATARVRIRRAALADVRAVTGVMRAAVRGLAHAGYGPRRITRWSSLPPLYHAWAMTAGGERYFLAERGGRVLGYAALRGDEVSAAFVLPSCAGRGIGGALLRRLEREARREGVRALRVAAALSAVPFYEALGFRGTRRIRVPLPGGETLPARTLRKRIGG